MTRLLNIGCGDARHSEWVNIDFEPTGEGVIACDVRRGLPFETESFDAVYASHVLEHLHRPQAAFVLQECFRVLRRGGVLRLAVPDLERIARLYLDAVGPALEGDADAQARHEWLMLEMYDQAVRTSSGGAMGDYLASAVEESARRFIIGRIGELGTTAGGARSGFVGRLRRGLRVLRREAAGVMVQILLGREGREALKEGLFRRGGEVHQWMYDRYSLQRAVAVAGFRSYEVRAAGQSEIPDFARYGLEVRNGRERKPDSIYVESRKP